MIIDLQTNKTPIDVEPPTDDVVEALQYWQRLSQIQSKHLSVYSQRLREAEDQRDTFFEYSEEWKNCARRLEQYNKQLQQTISELKL